MRRKSKELKRKQGAPQKARKPTPFKQFLVSKLRSACQKWEPYYRVKNAAKVEATILEVKPGPNLGTWEVSAAVEGHGFRLYIFFTRTKPKLGRRVLYKCEKCSVMYLDKDYFYTAKGTLKKMTCVTLDHIVPVISEEGFTDWNSYIERMFPQGEGKHFQAICRRCHETKCTKEREKRNEHKKTKAVKATRDNG